MADSYRPLPEVLDRVRRTDFVAIVGPTAAGKSTLIRAAVEAAPDRFKEIMVTTSRLPRSGEKDGVDIHFTTREAMEHDIARRQFVQIMRHPSGDLYATRPEEYPAQGAALMPVLAAVLPVFRALPFKRFRIIYILPPDFGTWLERINAHGFTDDQRAKRFVEAKESLQAAVGDPDVLFVVSDGLAETLKNFQELLSEKPVDYALQAALRDHAECLRAQMY